MAPALPCAARHGPQRLEPSLTLTVVGQKRFAVPQFATLAYAKAWMGPLVFRKPRACKPDKSLEICQACRLTGSAYLATGKCRQSQEISRRCFHQLSIPNQIYYRR